MLFRSQVWRIEDMWKPHCKLIVMSLSFFSRVVITINPWTCFILSSAFLAISFHTWVSLEDVLFINKASLYLEIQWDTLKRAYDLESVHRIQVLFLLFIHLLNILLLNTYMYWGHSNRCRSHSNKGILVPAFLSKIKL